MNTTDNAFIKAYAEELAVALGRPARQVDRRVIRPNRSPAAAGQSSQRVSLSELYTAAAERSASAPPEVFPGVAAADGPAHREDHRHTMKQEARPLSLPAGLPSGEREPSLPTSSPARSAEQPRQITEMLHRLDAADPMAPRHWHASFADGVRGAAEAPVQHVQSSADPAIMADRPTGTIPPPPADCREVRPQWEVDRFQWPSAVDRLVSEFGDLLSGILDRLMDPSRRGARVTAVTGYARGEGRTTLALALARLAARRGISVIVVDGDHEHSQVAQQLGLSFDKGWDEQGSGADEVSEVAVQSLEDNFSVLPLRSGPRAQTVNRQGAARMLATLASAYDLLLVDVGPMFTAARYWFEFQADRAIDSALVVRGVDTVSDTQLADVVERLSCRHVPILGIIENFSVTQPVAAGKLAS